MKKYFSSDTKKKKALSTKTLVERIFSQPTAPFREQWVLNEIKNILDEYNIPYFTDSWGNLIAGSHAKSVKKAKLALMAHTDHPGFHLQKRISKSTYQALWLGGGPFHSMVGAKVRVHDPLNKKLTTSAVITKFDLKKRKNRGIPMQIKLKSDLDFSTKAFGAFDFPGVSFIGDKIKTRAADDLAGCVIALGALIDTHHDRPHNLISIFTRAEEVGFVGCLGLLKSKILPQQLAVVSLEASKELPGALQGKGPVLRVGDRVSLFDTDFSNLMLKVAKNMKNFEYQRKHMDGGACEATALTVFEFKTSGLSVPLVNYHNETLNKKVGAEAVSLKDVDGARRFCSELAKKYEPNESWKREYREELVEHFSKMCSLLDHSSNKSLT